MAGYRDEPENPVYKFVAVIIGIIYVAAIAMCILCLATNLGAKVLGKIITSLSESQLESFAKLYGFMLLALLPSAIIFVANRAPIEMTKTTRILLWIAGSICMAGLIWLFFHVSGKEEYAQILGDTTKDLYGIWWLRCNTIVAAAGIFSLNIMCNFMPDFNSANALGDFMGLVWGFFAELNTGYVIYVILTFVTLPWAFLILPVAGVIVAVLLLTLIALVNMD